MIRAITITLSVASIVLAGLNIAIVLRSKLNGQRTDTHATNRGTKPT